MSPTTRSKSTTPKKRMTKATTTKATATKGATRSQPTTRKKTPRAVAAIAAAPEATTPRGPRRVIFVDVENTSSEVDLMTVLDSLKIDRTAQSTELVAVGNWRTVGQRLGRRLASLGAQLVHSAPATGVRDWSDLWIAVAAGCWLGKAAPGDTLEIVSDDRAFDAVGDAATAIGVTFRRISHRTASRAAHPVAATAEPGAAPSHRGRRHRRGRRPSGPPHVTRHAAAPSAAHPPSRPAAPPAPPAAVGEGHPASHEQIVAVVTRLTSANPERWISLDVLANALKAEGFTRPPGSPRLVTRLRKLKGLEVSPNGMLRLVGKPAGAGSSEPAPPAESVSAAPRRPRRRGGRSRHRRATDGNVATPEGQAEAAQVTQPPD